MVPGSSKVRLDAQHHRRRLLHGRRRVCVSLSPPPPSLWSGGGGLIKCVVLTLRHGGNEKTENQRRGECSSGGMRRFISIQTEKKNYLKCSFFFYIINRLFNYRLKEVAWSLDSIQKSKPLLASIISHKTFFFFFSKFHFQVCSGSASFGPSRKFCSEM